MGRCAVALLSGGLDSGVSLAMWLARPECSVSFCLTFDYGQASVDAEQQAASRLAARHGIEWRSMSLPFLTVVAAQVDCALLPRGAPLPRCDADDLGDAESAAAVWVPARNVVFLAIAAAFAEANGDAVVLTGFNREEAQTFPDNSAAFVSAMDAVLALGTRNGVTVCSPTLEMSKAEIVAVARGMGYAVGDFWSCYGPPPAPCGVCESCARSRAAWGG